MQSSCKFHLIVLRLLEPGRKEDTEWPVDQLYSEVHTYLYNNRVDFLHWNIYKFDWAYIILIGVTILVLCLFIISYYPLAIFGTTLIAGGLAVYGVQLGKYTDKKGELLRQIMYDNLELAFRTYDKRTFYRVFVPSSMGENGMLLLENFP